MRRRTDRRASPAIIVTSSLRTTDVLLVGIALGDEALAAQEFGYQSTP